MPKLDGFEVLQSIRKFNHKIKVIMFSSLEEIKKAILAMQMGAFNYISKPYDVNVLTEILKSATKDSSNSSK
jgi:DNA-binding NtrC family response regulator